MRRPAATSLAIGPRELDRRAREHRRRIGGQVREIREDLGATQADLARAVGVAPSHVARIEAGTVGMSQLTHLAIAAALGADLSVRLFPTGGAPIRDRFQAPIVEALIRALDESWTPRPEVLVGSPRRRIIDVVLGRGRLVIACEVHSELRRVEEVLRRASETEHALATEGLAEITSRLLIVRSTVTTRAVARQLAATLSAAYPARAADAFDALTEGDRAWPGAAILWARLEAGRAELLRFAPRGVSVGR
ncbi:MAG: helix-turn-helix transcriptional regulator [Chloroflexota bacterium]